MSCKVCHAYTNSDTNLCPECLIERTQNVDIFDPFSKDADLQETEDLPEDYFKFNDKS